MSEPSSPRGCPDSVDEVSAASPRLRLLAVLAALALVALAGCASPSEEGSTETSEATVAFAFDGLRAEDPQRIEESVTYDPDARPTMQLYESTEAERPDAYTAHDLLVDFSEETNTSVDVQYREGLGYKLAAVDGVPSEDASTFWALYVDGERETAGLGTVVVEPNATYAWRLHDRAGGDSSSSSDTSSDSGTRAATMIVDYNGFRSEDPQRTEDTVRYDPSSRPTMPRYEASGVERPDAYILDDLVSDWSNQTGNDHAVREDEDTGFRLKSIDGVTAHSTRGGSWTWQLTVDGESETAGLNAVEIEPGSTYTWTFERTSDG